MCLIMYFVFTCTSIYYTKYQANSQSQMKEIERLRREDTSTEKPKRENILMETEKVASVF